MPATKVKSVWENGNLVFKNNSGHRVMNIPESGGGRYVEKIALKAGNANAFAFAWQNPNDCEIIVESVFVDITTAGGTAGSVLDVGIVNAATDTASTIHNDLDLNATGLTKCTGVGKMSKAGGATDHLTGKILTQNAAALVGNAYIIYFLA
jgi:hypothetical protein